MFLKAVKARKILDSRGEPTIEVQIQGVKASAPAGKSTGVYETPPYYKSLSWNIQFLNTLSFDLKINTFSDLEKVESLLKKKAKISDVKKFGANALMALEVAVLKALAHEQKKELWQIIDPAVKKMPIPVGNVIGGGLHAHHKDHPVFQEFLLIPKGKTFTENYTIMRSIHADVQKKLRAKTMSDEGAWETSLNEEEILTVLKHYAPKTNLGVDIAASSFWCEGTYVYGNKKLDAKAQGTYIHALIKKYDLRYVEDPLQEEDFKGFAQIPHSSSHMIVGDDLTATHMNRIKKAYKKESLNAVIVKPNQNGSLREVKEIIGFCKDNNITTILSHRSGETLDNALADLAVGFKTDYIKCGIATKWREAKLKRLQEIEKKLIPN